MSGAPIMIGTNQLPNPPIKAGMTTKNTMISPCALTMLFHIWPSAKYCMPGFCSSMRIRTDSPPPMIPAMTENTRYSVPMSLWLVLRNQRWKKGGAWS